MSKESNKIVAVYKKVYLDMLGLNKSFIQSIRRPASQMLSPPPSVPLKKRPLSKKQLKALEKGRAFLASKRGKTIQV